MPATTTLRRLTATAATLAVALTAAPAALADDTTPVPLEDGRGIIGGYLPHASQWPWMTAILDRTKSGNDYYRQMCGGALIAPKLVLTAAHCVVDNGKTNPASRYEVAIGKRRLSTTAGETIGVTRVVAHPKYGTSFLSHDLALLYLERPSAYQPAALADPAMPLYQGNMVTSMGWGRQSLDTGAGDYYGNHSDDLKAIDMPLWSYDNCRRGGSTVEEQTFYSKFDPNTMVCAGYADSAETTCKGDSGSPMMIPDASGTWRLLGMVSWGGPSCGGGMGPTVFAWIGGPEMYSFVVSGIQQSASSQSVIPSGQPGGPTTSGPASTSPTLSGARLAKVSVRRGKALTIRYTSSVAGKTTLRVSRGTRAAGSWTANAQAGENAVRLPISRRTKAGRYRVSISVGSASGTTNVVTLGYRVVR